MSEHDGAHPQPCHEQRQVLCVGHLVPPRDVLPSDEACRMDGSDWSSVRCQRDIDVAAGGCRNGSWDSGARSRCNARPVGSPRRHTPAVTLMGPVRWSLSLLLPCLCTEATFPSRHRVRALGLARRAASRLAASDQSHRVRRRRSHRFALSDRFIRACAVDRRRARTPSGRAGGRERLRVRS